MDPIPLTSVGREFGAQRREGPRQVRGDRTRRDAEHFSGVRGIQIQEDPQRDDLALAGWEPLQHGCQIGVCQAGGQAIGGRVVVGQRQFPAVPAPR
jgi:hypothetical protein